MKATQPRATASISGTGHRPSMTAKTALGAATRLPSTSTANRMDESTRSRHWVRSGTWWGVRAGAGPAFGGEAPGRGGAAGWGNNVERWSVGMAGSPLGATRQGSIIHEDIGQRARDVSGPGGGVPILARNRGGGLPSAVWVVTLERHRAHRHGPPDPHPDHRRIVGDR